MENLEFQGTGKVSGCRSLYPNDLYERSIQVTMNEMSFHAVTTLLSPI
uniref:Uncharacterized protein n=1 Tax=Lepeophtheirus salmonis TaxID=72036 RepID=A0A0K2U450_LEPSM